MESFRSRGIGPEAAVLLGALNLDNYTDEELRGLPTAQLAKYVSLSRFLTIPREDLYEHATVGELAQAGFKLDDLVGHYDLDLDLKEFYPHFSIDRLRCYFTPSGIFSLIDDILSKGGFDVVEDRVSLKELRGIGLTASEIIQSRYFKGCKVSSFADAGFTVKEVIDQIGDALSLYTLAHCKEHLGLAEIVKHSDFTLSMELRPFFVEELQKMFSRQDVMKQLAKKLRSSGYDVVAFLQNHYELCEISTEVSPCEMMQASLSMGENFDHRLRQEWFPQLKCYPPAQVTTVDLLRSYQWRFCQNMDHRVYSIVYAGLLDSLIDEIKSDYKLCRAVCSSKLTDMFSPLEIICYFGNLASDDELRSLDLPLDLFLSKMPATCVSVHGVNLLIVSGLAPKKVRISAGDMSKPLFSSDAVKLILEANEGDWLKSAEYSVETLHSMGCKFEQVHPVYGISNCGIFGVAEYKRANVALPILLKVFTMRELIEGWGDRLDLARHCRESSTLTDLAKFFSVEELVSAGYTVQQILQCSFELRELSKSFSVQDLCYKHLQGVYLSVSLLKDFYAFGELSLCFPLVELVRVFNLAVVIDGIKFGAYSAMNIDTTGRALGLDWTIRDLRWNGLTLDHIPTEHLHYWNLCRLHPTFSMDDLRLQYGMVEIAKAFSPRELAKHFSLQDFMGHFPCCELLKHFNFVPEENRMVLLGCLKRCLVEEQQMTSIREHILRDGVHIHELTQFVRHAREFDRIGLHLRDLRSMGLGCKDAINLGYKIDSLRGGGYTCEDVRDCGLDHVFAAHAGFSLYEIQDAVNLTNVDRCDVEEILMWGHIDNDFS